MSKHEEQLLDMTGDPELLSADRAACLAGAEALRLVKAYQRAHADHQRAKHEDVGQEITWAARKAAKRALLATEVTR